MCVKYVADAEAACKTARRCSTLERFTTLSGGGPVLMMTARFGRSPVRDAAYRLRAQRRDLDLKLSWQLFAGLEDWCERWPTEQNNFAAGLILSTAGDPVVERAVGRCIYDLAAFGRPLLWGLVSHRIRWHPRFALIRNGWPPELILPHPATHARLRLAQDAVEFRPLFDTILFAAEPDYFIFDSRLNWRDARHSLWIVRRG